MRLKRFINEYDESDYNELFDLLERDCKPFIDNFLKKHNTILFRGSTMRVKGFIERKRVRENRKPYDTPLELHNEVDEIFKKYYGWNVRSNSAFVSPSFHTAIAYGTGTYLFFPIGKYDFVYSKKIHDLFGFFGQTSVCIRNSCYGIDSFFTDDRITQDYIGFTIGNLVEALINVSIKNNNIGLNQNTKIVKSSTVRETVDEIKDYILDILDKVIKKYYTKNKFVLGSSRKSRDVEMAFKCKEYYLVDTHMIDRIEDKYNIRRQ